MGHMLDITTGYIHFDLRGNSWFHRLDRSARTSHTPSYLGMGLVDTWCKCDRRCKDTVIWCVAIPHTWGLTQATTFKLSSTGIRCDNAICTVPSTIASAHAASLHQIIKVLHEHVIAHTFL